MAKLYLNQIRPSTDLGCFSCNGCCKGCKKRCITLCSSKYMHMQIYCRVLEFAFLVLEPVYGRRFDSKPIDLWCTKDENPGAHRELLKILVDISCAMQNFAACSHGICIVVSQCHFTGNIDRDINSETSCLNKICHRLFRSFVMLYPVMLPIQLHICFLSTLVFLLHHK